jgi:hypothetical protein
MTEVVKIDERYWAWEPLDPDLRVEEVPRVSTILQPAGLPDSAAPAALRGQRVHAWTEARDLDRIEPADLDRIRGLEMEAYLGAYVDWAARREWAPRDVELTLVGRLDGKRYAGTIDRVGHIRERRALVDLKTTVQDKPGRRAEHAMQLAAYAHAWEALRDETIQQLLIVFLQPTGRWVEVEHTADRDKALAAFDVRLKEHYGWLWQIGALDDAG